MPFIVYAITNLTNEKQYIGITTRSIKKRFSEHCKANSGIGNAIRKYGANNFTIVQIDIAKSWEELCEKEIHYISKYDTYKNGYNQTLGGDGAPTVIHKEIIKEQRELEALKRIEKCLSEMPKPKIMPPIEALVIYLELIFKCDIERERKEVAKGINKLNRVYKEKFFELAGVLCPFVNQEFIDYWANV